MKTKLLLLMFVLAAMMVPQGTWATEDLTRDAIFDLTTVGDGTANIGTFNTSGITKTAETAWTLNGTTPYITINLTEPLEVGDIIEISGKSNSSSKYFRFYNSTTFGSTYAGAEIGIGTSEGVKQVVVKEPPTVTNTLIGKSTIYMNYSSSDNNGTVNYIKVYKGNPKALSSSKSWDFTGYTVNATATTSDIIHNQILFGKGISVISMTDYKADKDATESTCTLLNIPGNSGNLENGKYVMFRVPAGKTTVSMDIVTNGKSGSKSLMYKIGNNDAVSESMSNVKYPVTKTFDVYASEVTPVYIYVGGTSNTFYFKSLSLTITPAPTATIGANGWTTFSSAYPLDLSAMTTTEGDVKAYYAASASGSTVTMTSTDASVPAGEGLMLKGTAGATITIPVAESGTAISGNKLKGCPTETIITIATLNYANFYVLNASTAQFQNIYEWIYNSGGVSRIVTIPAGKAYLDLTGVSLEARSLSISFDDETTNIEESVKNEKVTDKSYYNLSGQRVLNPSKGLYIVNGKKVMIK